MRSPETPALSPRDIVGSGLCIGCGGCAAGAKPAGATMEWDRYGQLKPTGPESWYRQRTPEFARLCPFSPAARDEDSIAIALYPEARVVDSRIGRFEEAYVGAVSEQDFRTAGSSGGMVTWIAAELLRRGLVDGVAHVAPAADRAAEGRFFGYRISRSQADVRAGAKSRYYPIELSAVLDEIRAVPGRYAVVGVPCFIKSVNLQRAEDEILRERITHTLGLFCGHMKSARFVESFAWQLDVPFDAVKAVEYRMKNADRPANWYTAHLTLQDDRTVWQDWWHLVDGDWGAGYFQNSACNFCDDVVAETADISFGDAWVEPYSSDGRGTNVVVVRAPELHAIVEEAIAGGRLALETVDAEFIVGTQAAGFRQRREGLAWRLAHRRRGTRPRKRVPPAAAGLPPRRKLIYWMRARISAWSHRIFFLAREIERPSLYIRWGRATLALYQGLTYSRGRIGAAIDRIERKLTSSGER
ncbi:Coenzyme F420 hydrogenase/dehydrogenase, beta subunit C-terminal domain [Sphingosinicella sp. BN140058]|uniref:Coenzyme F420 hydrogenase/dehydrogenase, beta subunit C-terminal domain n=1 Tax=Sphingosinicella sp. BN140058 TaxID=1892855 RepID=UPI001010C8C6|nr:Coenzyme F420 hydrogenase/dehydrogenase, beta subunit C-terminal domain [Sphingosinicella sp. BN140058]QAY77429.1 coenzyme F420 hydrogenase [Sphingosinicella sp. BN140058]